MSDENVDVNINAHDNTKSGFDGAKHQAEQFGDAIKDLSHEFIGEFAKMAAAVISIEKAFEFVKEGVGKADELRDLTLSLAVFTGSMNKAVETMKYFEEEAKNTRETGDDLAKVFRDVLPMAISRGFSQQTMRTVTVWLSQLGTVAGKSLESMEASFKQLLAGRVTTRNPILQVLGISKEQMKNLGWDELLKKMQDVAEKAETFGQSFHSMAEKVKDAWLDAFGTGFNEAMGGGRQALDEFIKTFTDPVFIEGLTTVGSGVAKLVLHLRDLIQAFHELRGETENSKKVPDWLQFYVDFYSTGGAASNPQVAAMQQALKQQLSDAKDQQDASNVMAGRSAAGQAGIGNVSGYGGTVTEFFARVNADLMAHKDKTKEIIEALRDEVHGGVISWTDYTSTINEVTKITEKHTNKLDQNLKALGKVRQEAEKLQTIYLSYKNLDSIIGKNMAGSPGVAGQSLTFTSSISDVMNRLPEFTNSFGQVVRQAQSAAKDMAKTFATDAITRLHDEFTSQAGSLVSAFVQEGAKGFGRAAAAEFSANIGKGAENFAARIIAFVSGGRVGADGKIYDANNKEVTDPTQLKAIQAKQKAAGMAVNFLQTGFGGYQMGRSNQDGSIMMGAASGAMSGLTFGVASAVVGAIIGGLAAAYGKQQARADYQYGVPGVDKSGQAYFDKDKNFTDSAAKQVLERVQATFDQVWNGYVNLLLKIPNSIIPALKAIDGKFQPNPSGHYLEHLEEWLTEKLPSDIANQFKDGMQSAYVSMGMSVSRFQELWTKFDKLDPAKRLQLWNDIADTLLNFQKASDILSARSTSYGPDSNIIKGPWNTTLLTTERNSSFMDQATKTDDQIMRLAEHLKDLTGEAQIQAAKELSQLVLQKAETEKQMMMELINLMDSARQMFGSALDQNKVKGMMKTDGTPDYDAIAQFYKSKADNILASIGNTTDPAKLQEMMSEFIQYAQAAAEALSQLGPNSAKAAQQWLNDALEIGQQAFLNRIDVLGKTISDGGDKFMSDLQPYIDGFTQGLGDAGDAGDQLRDDLDNTHEPLERFVGRINDVGDALDGAVQRINAIGTGSGPAGRVGGVTGGYADTVTAKRYASS